MTTSEPDPQAAATRVEITDTHMRVSLADGRTLEVPLEWFPRLRDAAPADRRVWRLIGDGQGIHWPALDEDVSVPGLLAGRSAVRRPRGAA